LTIFLNFGNMRKLFVNGDDLASTGVESFVLHINLDLL